MKKKKVLIAMSGGVDSSVSAALLLEQNFEVIGAFMKNWSDCNWKEDERDAKRVAAKLGIPFTTFNFEKEYREKVVDYLFAEVEAGRTPNPDVMCNKFIKFDLFIKEADRLGCDFIATGHYTRVKEGKIFSGKDKNKDQSYFLWAIDPSVLSRVLFPLGELEKPEVRKKAKELDLSVAEKKDSTGICFIGEIDVGEFLRERIPEDPGKIVTTSGEVIGTHSGINFFTIGQRHGLKVGGGTPYYVVEKHPETKELVVSSNFHPSLFKKELSALQLNWFIEPTLPHKCMARIRYRQPLQKCTIDKKKKDKIFVSFDKPQRAVTPGQSIVFYNKEEMIGGGIIV